MLDSGARKNVFPLRPYIAIHPDVRHTLQHSTIDILLGVGSGDVPEAHIEVQLNNRQVSVHFLVAEIAGDEALLGHLLLTKAQAHPNFENNRIELFGEEMPYFQAERKVKIHTVREARTVVLEAGQEYVVKGHAHIKGAVIGEVMLSLTKNFVERHGVLVANVLVEPKPYKTVPLRIFNPGGKMVTVREGAIAGFLQPVKTMPAISTTTEPEQSGHFTVPQHLQELYHQCSTELIEDEQLQLAQLLRSYSSVFCTGPSDLGCTTLVQHDIATRPGIPVQHPPRRMSSGKQQDANQQIQQSLETGLARHSNNSWASPIVIVHKKDGTYRLCIDYRALQTVPIKMLIHLLASRTLLTPYLLPDGSAPWT